MKQHIVEKTTFHVIGIAVTTTNAQEANPSTAQLGNLWQTFFNNNISAQIPNRTPSKTIFSCYTNYDSDYQGTYTCVIGHEVTTLNTIPTGMLGITVPASHYQIFAAQGPMPQTLVNEWVAIWNYYDMPQSEKRTYLVDFEEHNPESPKQTNIHIGITQ